MDTGKVPRFVYPELLNPHVGNFQLLVEKWKKELDCQISLDELNTSFHLIYVSTISTEIRSFQFKFLHRIIYTRERLYKWNIVETNIWSFCNQEIKSLQHLFWECNFVKLFWQQVFSP